MLRELKISAPVICLILISCAGIVPPGGTGKQFPQIPNRQAYTLSWHADPDSTMGLFIINQTDQFGMPDYTIKNVPYPDSSCALRIGEMNFKDEPYSLCEIYMIAKDNAGNASGPSGPVNAVFAKDKGIWGDVAEPYGIFDASDLAVLDYLLYMKKYDPCFDFNMDGILDDKDREIAVNGF